MKNKTNKKGISIRQSNIILKVGQVAKEKKPNEPNLQGATFIFNQVISMSCASMHKY